MKIIQKKIDLSTNIVMGILNLSDNSFYDGGKYNLKKKFLHQTKKMITEGATIIDIGAQSSKPGSKAITESEEVKKLLFAIKEIRLEFPKILISVDTYRSKVAETCINNGANIINDISAGELDKKMFETIAKLEVPYIMMHMKGTPKNMQKKPQYNNIMDELVSYFEKKIKNLEKLGVQEIIIDPGFGFGKTINHNYQILNNLTRLKKLGHPVLVGVSRKSMIYNILNAEPNQALNGTTVINTIALQNGANILRVHDIKEAIECIKIINFAQNI